MHVLALNPYHGGSHRAFVEGWSDHSVHEFTLLTLPDRQWKWRMRSAAIAFADQIANHPVPRRPFDLIFTTDMVNLAEFRGLSGPAMARLPTVLYFHENQLTYPSRQPDDLRERDLHFGFTNIVSALSADEVWFNSQFHQDTFLNSVASLADRMPDPTLCPAAEQIRTRSAVMSPGIAPFPERRSAPTNGPLHLLWAARWEHDKTPDLLFDALRQAENRSCDFRLSVLGQSYAEVPACFDQSRQRFSSRIIHWGYLQDAERYRRALGMADVFISTADHEFFGIAAAEAIAAGCYPLLPDRLAYPELVDGCRTFLYDGSVESLCSRLIELERTKRESGSLYAEATPARRAVSRFEWPAVSAAMDKRLEALIDRQRAYSDEESSRA